MNNVKTMLKDLFMKNLGLKLLSVVLALLLWLSVMNLSDPTITKTIEDVPVQVINEEVVTSRGYGYTIETGETVDVRVKGRRTIVDSLTVADFVATADFNSFNKMYMATIDVTCRHENADELELTLRTETMAVKLEDNATEPRNIHIKHTGTVKEGYYLQSCTSETAMVTVSGAASQVEKVREVVAEVDVDKVMASFDWEVQLYAVDENGEKIDSKKVTLSQDSIIVNVMIYQTKLVDLKVVEKGTPAEHYYVDKLDYFPQLLVAADAQLIGTLNEIEIDLDVTEAKRTFDTSVDLRSLLEQKYGDRCVIADSATVLGINVQVKKMTKKDLSVQVDDIELKDTDQDNYVYSIVSLWKAGLTVWGKEEEMTSIEASDFDLYVELEGFGQGNHTIDIQSAYNGDLELEMGSVTISVAKKQVPVPTGAEGQPGYPGAPTADGANADGETNGGGNH